MAKKTKLARDIEKVLSAHGVEEWSLAYQTNKNPQKITVEGERSEDFDMYLHIYFMSRAVNRLTVKS